MPNGQFSQCNTEPSGSKPMIIYRANKQYQIMEKDRLLMARELSNSWSNCELKATEERCYIVTITKPPKSSSGNLTVTVVGDGKNLAGVKVGVLGLTKPGFYGPGSTSSNGSVSFNVKPSMYSVTANGCDAGYGANVVNVLVEKGKSASVSINLLKEKSCEKKSKSEPPKDNCSVDQYNKVFDKCISDTNVLVDTLFCKTVYAKFLACSLAGGGLTSVVCAGITGVDFAKCGFDLDHKDKVSACHNKANSASRCNYKFNRTPYKN